MHAPDTQTTDAINSSMIIGKPTLPSFLRTKLRMIGITTPYDFVYYILESRKTGNDLACFYDNWSNLVDYSHADSKKLDEIAVFQDQLLTTLSSFLDTCPLTSFLLHCDIKAIEELPDGLKISYVVDRTQVENTMANVPPFGYIPGTIVGY